VVGDPSRNPTANDYPSLEVPVRSRDLWRELDLTKDIAMDVYYDGQPQPIDGLEAIQDGEGATVTLVGRGGTDLESRDRRSIDYEPAHSVAETIINENTSYQANVDRPNTTVTDNQTVQTADTLSEWEDRRVNAQSTDPVEIADNDVSPLSIGDGEGLSLGKTAYVIEAENADNTDGNPLTVNDSDASDGQAVDLVDPGERLKADWDGIAYKLPEAEWRAAARWRPVDDADSDGSKDVPDFTYYVGSDKHGGAANDPTQVLGGYRWDLTNPPDDKLSDSDLSLPQFAVEIENNSENSTLRVDMLCIYDARYHDGATFDNAVDSNGYLASPTEYPVSATKDNYPSVQFRNAQTSQAAVGGRADLTVNDDTALEEIALSNDRGQTWTTSGADASSFETDFSDVGPSVRLRLTLSGTDATRSTATPTQGFERPEIDKYDLQADLEDLPLVVDWAPDASAMSNLQYIAETAADLIFEFRVDSAGTESIEMTVPGQRTSGRDDPISGFDVEETAAPVVERVVVQGSSRRVTAETITADIGNWVALDEAGIQLGRSVVTDPSTGNTYEEGTDYDIDPDQGRIRALSLGQLSDGTEYEVDYSYRPSGQDTISGAGSDPDTEVIDIPGLVSDRACEQAAHRILSQVDSPLQEATVTIPNDQTGWQIVDAVTFDSLPDGFENLEIREVTNTPAETVLRLGSRDSVGEVVGRIRRRVKDVSRRA